jgi:hypothetical protein
MVPAAPFPEAAAHTMSLIASKLQQPFFSSALGNSMHAALRIQLIQQGRVWRSTNSKAILITANWQMTQPGENVNQLLKMPEILAAAREKWLVIELKTLCSVSLPKTCQVRTIWAVLMASSGHSFKARFYT